MGVQAQRRPIRGLGGEVVKGEYRVAILDQALDRTSGTICARPMSPVRKFLPGRRPHMIQSEHGTARWTVSPLGRDADFFSR